MYNDKSVNAIVPTIVRRYGIQPPTHEQTPKQPCRSILLEAPTSGQMTLLQHRVHDVYRDWFDNAYMLRHA